MSALLLALRVALALFLVAEQYALAVWAGPDIEAALAPVLRRQSIDGIDRLDGGRLACFTWRFDKVKPAQATDANWTIRAGDAVYPYQRVRTVADTEPMGSGIILRPVKPGQWSRKCIDVPLQLVDRPFRITGFVEYRTPLTGRFWRVRQATAEAEVPLP